MEVEEGNIMEMDCAAEETGCEVGGETGCVGGETGCEVGGEMGKEMGCMVREKMGEVTSKQ